MNTTRKSPRSNTTQRPPHGPVQPSVQQGGSTAQDPTHPADGGDPAQASPVSEQGAEDESVEDARRSRDKKPAADKA